ncbi:serine hydrolase domain-containing protein [Actinosynnema sp. NPDC020468]|uniref:serine hydrolase domain-containing protein n=1 Tax=Actinosynnema sp. NPDC020468 TaxID=3154488 RepID=UPI0033FE3848
MRKNMRRAGSAVLLAAVLGAVVGQPAMASGSAVEESAVDQSAVDQSAVDQSAGRSRTELRTALGAVADASLGGGIVLRVNDRRGEWTSSAGSAELYGPVKPLPGNRFRAGSITKSFVATTVLQLVGEGKVALDKPIADYLPRFGVDRRITVRMLLQHRSGLFNYTGEPRADGTIEAGIPLWGKEYLDNLFHDYRAEEHVRLALSKPARFEPGAKYSYSNTNYTLLGLLIEKITGTDYATQVEKRIFRPLGMRDTSLPGSRTDIRGPHAHGYLTFKQDGKQKVVDITRLNASWAGAAGEIISTTDDLDRFITALLGGKLLKPQQLKEMRSFTETGAPGSRIGLGLFETEFAPGCTAVGHTGGTQGQTSYMYSRTDGSRRVEFSINHGALDREDTPAAQRIAEATTKLATTALCGKD